MYPWMYSHTEKALQMGGERRIPGLQRMLESVHLYKDTCLAPAKPDYLSVGAEDAHPLVQQAPGVTQGTHEATSLRF